jgi:hypothetical protein
VERRTVIAGYRAFFGALGVAAIVAQLADLAGRGVLNPVNFFSYFTILSNSFAVVVLLAGATLWRTQRSPKVDMLRGAAVLYMTVTLIVFALLLSGTDVDTAIPWVNAVVHQLLPVVMIVDWLIDPPVTRLTVRQGLAWLIPPLVWIVYTMIRGPIAGWYPYPFLDPANGGYGSVAVTTLVILAGGAVLCVILVTLGNTMRDRAVRPLGAA